MTTITMRLFAVLALAAAVVLAQEEKPIPTQTPYEDPRTNVLTSHGCYSSEGELEIPDDIIKNKVSKGYCRETACVGFSVFATKGDLCYCGAKYPPKAALVDDSNCNFICSGYALETCGGLKGGKFWSVYNTGIELDVDDSEPVAQTTESGSTSATESPTEASTEPSEPKGSANVGGIAAGVVAGVIVIAGAIGAVFYMKRRRNQEIEEEHRRNAAVNSFMGHKPGSSGGLSITDSRLDPVMVQRRLSDGSIADNQDYSRKILRVTNA